MPRSRLAWMARERGATRFLSNGSGGRSNTRKSTCAPTVASRRRVAGWTAMWHTTTGADRIPHLAGKRPIRPMSTSQRQARRRHNQRGDPLIDSSQTVQNRRATSTAKLRRLLAKRQRHKTTRWTNKLNYAVMGKSVSRRCSSGCRRFIRRFVLPYTRDRRPPLLSTD